MDLIHESYRRLFPEKEFAYESALEYNRRLSDFNANISWHGSKITVHLNLQWKDIDEEIKIGLIQHLLLKMFKVQKSSPNIELYLHFVKNISILIPKTRNDPLLEESFLRVNESFFEKQLEKPNLTWGQDSFRKLASYNFHDDTITVSTLFQEVRPEVLDYLLYHELLHKALQFKHKNGRSSYHHREFRRAEALYPQQKEIEQEIQQLLRQKRLKKNFSWPRWFRFGNI